MAKFLELDLAQEPGRAESCKRKRYVRGGKESLGTAEVELAETEGPVFNPLLDQTCDEKPGDHKENIDAEVAGPNPSYFGVIQHDE
jgi:hypothetical protein